jgi:two-component system, cell cycle sensor histidine kinase and response regulator CckA
MQFLSMEKPRPMVIDVVFKTDEGEIEKNDFVRKQGDIFLADAYAPMVYQGRGAYLSGRASPLFDPRGKVVGAIESLRDITERKQLEDQLRQSYKMEAIGALAGGIAHDFNDILASVLGFTVMAIEDVSDPLVKKTCAMS